MVTGVGAGLDPICADQGAASAHERLTVPCEPVTPEPVQDVSDVGDPLSDHCQALANASSTP